MKLSKLGAVLACSSALWAGASFADYQLVPTTGSSGYDLPVGQAHVFNGPWLWGVRNIVCTVRADGREVKADSELKADCDANYPLTVASLKNRAVVNGYILAEGSTKTIDAHIGDKIIFEQNARSRLSVTNNGNGLVNLKCR